VVAESVLEYVLDGLEAALELERELGVRSVEFDRALLKIGESQKGEAAHSGDAAKSGEAASSPLVRKELRGPCFSRRTDPSSISGEDAASPFLSPPPPPEPKQSNNSNNQTISPLIFVHDRPLSEKGVEMMAKIITAMGRTAETAPIVVAPPMPKAKIVVVLGGLALKKYFPGMCGEPGQWQKLPEGTDVLITYSPEYILRFATVTPAVQKIKQDMWRSLKAVIQRLG